MRRRRFLLALGIGVPLAGCSGPDDDTTTTTTTTSATETETTTSGPPSGREFLEYLLTAEELGADWERTFQSTVPRYAERALRNTATGRRVGVAVQGEATVEDAEAALAEFRSNLAGGEEIDADVGEVAYEAYPDEFDTGVLFRSGVYVAFAAVAAGEGSGNETQTPLTVEDALGYAERLAEKLPA